MIKKLLVPLAVLLFATSAWACRPMPLEQECSRAHRVKLENKTYKGLYKSVKIFQDKLDGHLAKAFKKNADKRGLTSCFNNHFSGYYLSGIEAYAKNHQGYVCSSHLSQAYYNITQLTGRDALEFKKIVNENARMDLLNQGMNVSEALLYFKNKHTK